MSNEPFRESDFEMIAEFEFDFVRLPMSYKCWSDENDWYKINEDKLKEIDQAVGYGRHYAFHWRLFAERYKGIPNGKISFNLLNEPDGTTQEKHDRVIRRLVKDIREADPERLIIIDGFEFKPSFSHVELKLAQCPRGYSPGQVTHYKATWLGDTSSWKVPQWPMKRLRDGKMPAGIVKRILKRYFLMFEQPSVN